jgi:hypothetical protein
LVGILNREEALSPEQELLLSSMLTPFKLLVLRSAQQVPRLAVASSMRRFPKDLCRMVGDMMGPHIEVYESEEEE